MNRFATAAWSIGAMSWLLMAHKADSVPMAVVSVLFAIAFAYVALIHRDKENR